MIGATSACQVGAAAVPSGSLPPPALLPPALLPPVAVPALLGLLQLGWLASPVSHLCCSEHAASASARPPTRAVENVERFKVAPF